MAAPTCREGVEAGSCHPQPFRRRGREGGAPARQGSLKAAAVGE